VGARDLSDEARALMALTRLPGLGPVRIARLIDARGSPTDALRAPLERLKHVEGIGAKTAAAIVGSRADADALVARELDQLDAIGTRVVTILDAAYPPLLKLIPSAPPVLRVRGELDPERIRDAVAIVGSRRCTIYGTEQAGRFAGSLGSAGVAIVSGGARGIDAAAHTAALDAGATTIVVQGCGLGHTYPGEHKDLYERVVNSGGAVVSELPFDTPPSAENFPARNRIISGLALGVLVIEAGRRSGALITARHAVEDHAREAFGVPGRVDSASSAGTNDLLKSGAHLVTEPGEVLEILGRSSTRAMASPPGPGRSRRRATAPRSAAEPSPEPAPDLAPDLGSLDPVARKIVEALENPMTGDELSAALGLDPATLRAHATMLEIQGRIRRAGSRFERSR